MTQRFRKQRGAVTLIGALFIIITLALMIQVLHRMAGSDILDTAVQNDSVEALFVAETGIEHASFLYANGVVGCPGLIGAGATAGRGSFSIINAALVGTDCRIRVQATVGSTGTAQANRTVDADLRLAANDGWIVGDSGTILRWIGGTWNAVASPTNDNLFDVHCVSTSFCIAVGERGTIFHWNGASWSTEPSNIPAFFGNPIDLFAVSCEPNNPSNCFAAGGNIFTINLGFFSITIAQGVIQHWNGTSWSNVEDTNLSGSDWRFTDLSCPSTTCYVVTANGFIGRYDTGSGNWVDDVSSTAVPLNGVACTADDYCWAVGNRTGSNWNLNFRNATGWTPITVGVIAQARRNLNAVSCVDSTDCWAVGDRSGGRYVFGQWNGATWNEYTLDTPINPDPRDNLNGVHCISSTDCWAVGDYRNAGNVLHYDGADWSYFGAAVGNNIDLSGVHFPAGGGSNAVTLVRWQEVIN